MTPECSCPTNRPRWSRRPCTASSPSPRRANPSSPPDGPEPPVSRPTSPPRLSARRSRRRFAARRHRAPPPTQTHVTSVPICTTASFVTVQFTPAVLHASGGTSLSRPARSSPSRSRSRHPAPRPRRRSRRSASSATVTVPGSEWASGGPSATRSDITRRTRRSSITSTEERSHRVSKGRDSG